MRRPVQCAITIAAVAVVLVACGTTVETTFSTVGASPTTAASPTPSPTPEQTPSASIDPQARLSQTVDSGFDVPFSLRIPEDWTAVLRDPQAFQAYFGNEEFEITFDHTYREADSVDDRIARLAATAGLTAGPVTDVSVGGRAGKGFVGESSAAVNFVESGFHTNGASTLEVIVIPADDGGTITIFLTAGGDPVHGMETLGPLARRIFKTVDWQ